MSSYQHNFIFSDGTNTNIGNYGKRFTINLGEYKEYRIDSVILSNNFYQVNATNNTFTITFAAADTDIVIPIGNYDITDLCNVIQTQLRLIDLNFTVYISTTTQKITIENSAAVFGITWKTFANQLLGFVSTALTGSATYTGTNYIKMNQAMISLHSAALSLSCQNKSSDNRGELLYFIPVSSAIGDVTYFYPSLEINKKIPSGIGLQSIDFYFLDMNKQPIIDIEKCFVMITITFMK